MATSTYYEFPCGCKWPVIGPPRVEGALPLMTVDDNNLPDCPAVWELLSRGLTKGVFQLESSLGRHWSKKLKPEAAEHLCALGALLRPGCLKAKDEHGISMTERYCLRKNGEDDVTVYHPALAPILEPTFQVIAYQEQLMRIGKEIAGFDLVQVDKLRKAVGKKDQQELAKVEEMFIEGCKKMGIVTDEQALIIWGWMKKSGRYLFNKSHAMSYGLLGYDTAYMKAHFPVAFFANWLYFAKDKSDPMQEVAELVDDAKLFDVEVQTPDVRDLKGHVMTDGKVVRFGMADVKGVGDAQVIKMTEAVRAGESLLGKPIAEWCWEEFLYNVSGNVTTNVIRALIAVGGFRWTGKARIRLDNEFTSWESLTEKEQEWVKANCEPNEPLASALRKLGHTKKEGGGCANSKRVSSVTASAHYLDNPPASEQDTPNSIAAAEEKYLGIAITCCRVDSCDTSEVNCTCKDFLAGRTGYIVLGVEVKDFRVVKTRTGKNPGQKMAFLTVSDGTCSIGDVTVFPEAWAKFGRLLQPGNCVILQGERDQNRDAFLVNFAWQI